MIHPLRGLTFQAVRSSGWFWFRFKAEVCWVGRKEKAHLHTTSPRLTPPRRRVRPDPLWRWLGFKQICAVGVGDELPVAAVINYYKPGGLKEIYSLTVLEARHPKSRCWQDHAPSKGWSGGGFSLASSSSWRLLATWISPVSWSDLLLSKVTSLWI